MLTHQRRDADPSDEAGSRHVQGNRLSGWAFLRGLGRCGLLQNGIEVDDEGARRKIVDL